MTRDEAERAYDKAIVACRAAKLCEITALRMMRAGEITVAVMTGPRLTAAQRRQG